LAICCLVVFVLYLTAQTLYARHCYKISLALAVFLCAMSLIVTANVHSASQIAGVDDPAKDNDISPVGLYAIYLSIILLLYTAVPLPLYATVIVGVVYSTLFEGLLCKSLSDERLDSSTTFAVNVLLHVCVHVVGVHTVVTTQVQKGIIYHSI